MQEKDVREAQRVNGGGGAGEGGRGGGGCGGGCV